MMAHPQTLRVIIRNYRLCHNVRGGSARGCMLNAICTGKSKHGARQNTQRSEMLTASRYVQIVFSSSQHWKDYDVFRRQKDSTLRMSRRAVEELAHQFVTGVLDANHSTAAGIHGDQAAQVIFREMTELALWGNATDLSLLTNLSLHDIQKLQTKRAADENERSIVDDDLAEVWQLLRQNRGLPKERRRMDIILDNAGFELFTDVLYASYLLEAGFASGITLHAKSFPWFVSDVTAPDWDSLLEQLEDPKVFPVREHLDLLLACIKRHVDAGSLRLQVHPFWTTHHSFTVLSHEAPDLMKQLQDSYLTIWKGDLNYRKLTRDGLWPHTTPFQDALGQLGSGSGVRILSLRTNKSDTCVGVSEKRVLELEEEAPDKAWVKNGKYAVMSFSDGR